MQKKFWAVAIIFACTGMLAASGPQYQWFSFVGGTGETVECLRTTIMLGPPGGHERVELFANLRRKISRALIFVWGGGWTAIGAWEINPQCDNLHPDARKLLEAGVIFGHVVYKPVNGEYILPMQVNDVMLGLQAVQKELPPTIDLNIIGLSAGAHISLAAIIESQKTGHPIIVKKAFLVSPALHLAVNMIKPKWPLLFGDLPGEDLYQEALHWSGKTMVLSLTPTEALSLPIFDAYCGENDHINKLEVTRDFWDALPSDKTGELVVFKDTGHSIPWDSFMVPIIEELKYLRSDLYHSVDGHWRRFETVGEM